MRKIGWQLAIAIGGLLLVLGLLLGQTPDPQAAQVQPVEGGAYAEALIGSTVRLNPLLDRNNQVDRDIDRLLYGALIRFDSNGEAVPELAESFSISADATLYNLTIRDDAVWHDGQPVTAADVIYTFSKFKEPEYPGPPDLNAFWSDIEIVRLDDKNVQFQLPERFSPFLDYLAVGLLPDHLLRGVGARELIDHPFNLEPVGTGPFKFEGSLLDDDEVIGVSLTAFEQFVGGRPFLERIEFRFFDDPQAALRAYTDGVVDGIGDVGPEILASILADPSLNLHSSRVPATIVVFLNTRNPDQEFLGDKRFRQALLLGLNREWIIGSLLDGQGMVAASPILPGSWAHAENLQPMPFDPVLAGEQLTELGWELPAGAILGTDEYVRTSGDRTLELKLTYSDEPKFAELAAVLRSSWQALGIRVQLEMVEQATLVESVLEPREFEAVLAEIDSSRSPDPDPYGFWHDSQAETGQNYTGFQDRNISIWLEQARITPDRVRRTELYRDFQFRFRDQSPALLLFHPVFSFAISTDVQGISMGPIFDPSDRFANITEWFLLVRRGFAS